MGHSSQFSHSFEYHTMGDDDKKIILQSREGESFEVPQKMGELSSLVKRAIEANEDDDEDEMTIPLPNVQADVLRKVIDYCTHYINDEAMTEITTPLKSEKLDELVQQWYSDFCNVENAMLFALVTAANYMDIKPLLDLSCLAVSILIKGKSADEIRSIFNIPKPTPQPQDAETKEGETS